LKPLCRVEYNHADVVEFLHYVNYPVEWTEEAFKQALVVRVSDMESLIGYFWGTWVDHGIMAIHVAIDPDRAGAWTNPELVSELLRIAFWLGADEVVASFQDTPRAVQLERLARRFGFTEEPEFYDQISVFSLNLWNFIDGQPFQT